MHELYGEELCVCWWGRQRWGAADTPRCCSALASSLTDPALPGIQPRAFCTGSGAEDGLLQRMGWPAGPQHERAKAKQSLKGREQPDKPPEAVRPTLQGQLRPNPWGAPAPRSLPTPRVWSAGSQEEWSDLGRRVCPSTGSPPDFTSVPRTRTRPTTDIPEH